MTMRSIHDVARQAKVSVATVSRVLNNSAPVRPETAAQVHEVIRQLGYRPFATRRRPQRAFRAWPARPIAFVSIGQVYRNWFVMPVMAAVIGSATEVAKRLGWDVLLDEVPNPLDFSPTLSRDRIAGAVIFVSGDVAASPELPDILCRLNSRVPVVWTVGFSAAHVAVDHVTVNNLAIGDLAQRYLARRRCQRLGYVISHPTWPICRWRWRAFADAALPARAFIVSDHSEGMETYGPNAMRFDTMEAFADYVVRSPEAPDGLFVPVGNDGPEVASVLKRRGIEVGRNIELVCCDAEQVEMARMNPRPAVVDVNSEEIGHRTIAQLQHRMSHPDVPPILIQVAPRLLEPDPGFGVETGVVNSTSTVSLAQL